MPEPTGKPTFGEVVAGEDNGTSSGRKGQIDLAKFLLSLEPRGGGGDGGFSEALRYYSQQVAQQKMKREQALQELGRWENIAQEARQRTQLAQNYLTEAAPYALAPGTEWLPGLEPGGPMSRLLPGFGGLRAQQYGFDPLAMMRMLGGEMGIGEQAPSLPEFEFPQIPMATGGGAARGMSPLQKYFMEWGLGEFGQGGQGNRGVVPPGFAPGGNLAAMNALLGIGLIPEEEFYQGQPPVGPFRRG